jgi:hypothetical protein
MSKQEIIRYSVIAFLIIGVIILLIVLFKGKGSNTDDLYKQLIAAKDSSNKKEMDKIALYERIIEEKERTNVALGQRDSVLNVHYAESEATYKRINETLKNVPIRINRIATNNDSLRILLSTY